MDTSKLAVGQDVHLRAGSCGLDGKVTKIRWWGIYLQTYPEFGGRTPSRLLRFDKEGKERGAAPLFEHGPWFIDGTFTEREQARREHQPFIAWWKNAFYEQRLALVTKYYTTRLAPPP